MSERFILWDLDGTLADSESVKLEAHKQALEQLGGTMRTAYEDLIGLSAEAVTRRVMFDAKVEYNFELYQITYSNRYEALAQNIALVPGATEVLAKLRALDVHLGVVTSGDRHHAEYTLESTGIRRYFDVLVTADDVNHCKPNPEPYLIGIAELDRLGPGLAVEDTHAGLTAARAAGLPVIAVRHQYNGRHNFSKARAVLLSLEDSDLFISTVLRIFAAPPKITGLIH